MVEHLSYYKKNKLRFNKLIYKLKYLNAELTECECIFNVCKKEFNVEFEKNIDKLSKQDKLIITKMDEQLKHTKTVKDTQENEELKIPIFSATKSLYRKVAFETHPDKGHNKKRVKLFNEAKLAYSSNDWFNLTEIAVLVGVKLPIPTFKQLRLLKKKETDIRKEINTITDSVSWNWFNTEDNSIKTNIMTSYLNSILGNKQTL
jgi:hypothetical protein